MENRENGKQRLASKQLRKCIQNKGKTRNFVNSVTGVIGSKEEFSHSFFFFSGTVSIINDILRHRKVGHCKKWHRQLLLCQNTCSLL